jgi:hypothetical protein
MSAIVQNFVQLLYAFWELLISLLAVIVPWTPLVAWVAFWLYAVNWVKLAQVLLRGGLVALILLGLVATLVWGVVAPPEGGAHHLLGLSVGNYVGKFVYVTALIVIMIICGSVQLAGLCGSWANFPEEAPEPEHGDAHGHDAHGHDAGHQSHSLGELHAH